MSLPIKSFGQAPLLVAACLCLGCAREYAASDARIAQSGKRQTTAAADSSDASGAELALTSGSAAAGTAPADRKIIYTADLDLVVDDFQGFEKQLPQVIEAAGGFVASRKTDRRHGDHRQGSWTIRVPVAKYDSLLSGITALGFARSRNETSQDVTEDYVDLQARISNHRKLEQRILDMLEHRSGKLEDLLEMERELSRVRETIERMEGRLRVLTDQTDLATIRLAVTEQATYEPPAAPTFGDRVAAAWTGSLQAITRAAAALAIALVAIVPWSVIAVPLAVVVAIAVKRIGGGRPGPSRP